MADGWDQILKEMRLSTFILVLLPSVLLSPKNQTYLEKSKKVEENICEQVNLQSIEAQLQYGFIHKNHRQTY